MDKNVFIQNLKDTTTVLQQLEVCIEQLKEGIDEINNINNNINSNIFCHNLNITVQSSPTNIGYIYLSLLSNKETLNIDDIHTYLGNNIQSCTGYISDTSYLTVIGISKNGSDFKLHCINVYGYTYVNVSKLDLDIILDTTRKVAIKND